MSVKIKVISLIGGTNHRSYGPLVEGKEYEIEVSRFCDRIFRPKTKKDEKAIKDYIASLNKPGEVAAAPPEGKIEEDSSNG